MEKHPIESVMSTTMENIRSMIDVNTIVGDAITTADGSTVVPISRVSLEFVAGGAGVTVQPIGLLVTGPDQVRLLPAQPYAPIDRVIELIPQTLSEVKTALANKNKKVDSSEFEA